MDLERIEQRLRSMLEEDRSPQMEVLRELPPGGDIGDMASMNERKGTTVLLTDRRATRDAMIQKAIDRVYSGEYGTCTGCGEPIGEKRLEFMPETPVCCSCQRALENRQR